MKKGVFLFQQKGKKSSFLNITDNSVEALIKGLHEENRKKNPTTLADRFQPKMNRKESNVGKATVSAQTGASLLTSLTEITMGEDDWGLLLSGASLNSYVPGQYVIVVRNYHAQLSIISIGRTRASKDISTCFRNL